MIEEWKAEVALPTEESSVKIDMLMMLFNFIDLNENSSFSTMCNQYKFHELIVHIELLTELLTDVYDANFFNQGKTTATLLTSFHCFGLSAVWGVRVEQPSLLALVFKYFRQFNGPSTFVIFAWRLYNHNNHTHAPDQHIWPSPGPGPDSKCSKIVEIWCSC